VYALGTQDTNSVSKLWCVAGVGARIRRDGRGEGRDGNWDRGRGGMEGRGGDGDGRGRGGDVEGRGGEG